MTAIKPTEEQAAILEAFSDGDRLMIEAAAGSGKTTSLKMTAKTTRRRGVYLAYNKAIKEDAARSFPATVRAVTSHGLAYGAVARDYRHRLNGPRVPAMQAAILLGLNEPVRLDKGMAPLAPQQLARITMATLARWCHSADEDITARNVPIQRGLEQLPAIRAELAKVIVPAAQRAWSDITNPRGRLRFEHDHYLKMYQLRRPVLDVDYLLVDEAQDLNPVVQAIVGYQQDAQVCLVGDRCQQLYAWRGAVDSMSAFAGKRLYLSQSFRFGPAIADEANKWLAILAADLRVRGLDSIQSTIGQLEKPRAILCRTNGGALSHVMSSLDQGRKVALVGGGTDIARLAKAAMDLKAGRPTEHPELLAFASWAQVQDYADQDPAGADLKVMINLIDRHGPKAIIAIADRLTAAESKADVVISTGHRGKGREWESVQIAPDFREPASDEDGDPPDIDRAEAMLAYVAVTRAKLYLDRGGLSWVDRYLTEMPAQPVGVVEDAPPSPEPVLSWTADPCPQCGYLTGQDGVCQDCTPPARSHCPRCGSQQCICGGPELRRYQWGGYHCCTREPHERFGQHLCACGEGMVEA